MTKYLVVLNYKNMNYVGLFHLLLANPPRRATTKRLWKVLGYLCQWLDLINLYATQSIKKF